MTKQELIKTLSEIKEDLPIVPVVSGSIYDSDEEYSYYLGNVTCVEVGSFTEYDGKIYTNDPAYIDDLEDAIILNTDEEEYKDLTEEDFEKWLKSKTLALDWHRAVLLYIGEY